jgi:hypothetical protein
MPPSHTTSYAYDPFGKLIKTTAAVEALGVAADLAVEHVEIDNALRAVLGDAVGAVRRRLDEVEHGGRVERSGGAARAAIVVAAAELIRPRGLGAVRAHFLLRDNLDETAHCRA